jgi:acyl carrier protein|tara:strand:+ start:3220 stop:3633 length:414 start_codon:yes stop_codon:yes gene_type:complete
MSHSVTFTKIRDILRSAPKPVTDEVLLEVASLAIAETLGERASEPVTWDSKINDDLGLDSLDTVELVMFLEECFSVEIRDEQAGEIVTVGDAITIIKENKAGKPRKVDKRKVSKSFAKQAEARAKQQAELDKALDED